MTLNMIGGKGVVLVLSDFGQYYFGIV